MTWPAGDERGSLVVALAVMMVLTGLSVAVLARTLGALRSARVGQDRASALAAADAGLSDALFALDQLPLDTAPPADIPGPTSHQSGTIGAGGSYAWRASQLSGDPNTYVLLSSGTVNGVTRTVSERATRRPRYPFALFGADGITFNGSSPGVYPQGIWAESGGTFDPSRRADIGSNRGIVIGSGASGGGGGDAQVVFTPAGACSGCPRPTTDDSGPYATPNPVVPSGASACPGGGVVDGTGTPVTIAPGTYLCTGDLTLTGNVSAGGTPSAPVVIYLQNGPTGSGPPTTLHLGHLTMPSTFSAAAFLVLKAGPGLISDDLASVEFRGVIDAPQASLTSRYCQIQVTGALTVGAFACDSPDPAFVLEYDRDVESLLSSAWRTSDFAEIAPRGL